MLQVEFHTKMGLRMQDRCFVCLLAFRVNMYERNGEEY